MKHFWIVIVCLFSHYVQAKPVLLTPWVTQIRPVADSSVSIRQWDTNPHFVAKELVSIPHDIGNATKIIVDRSSFVWNRSENPTIHISPTDYPMKLYVNGYCIYQFGVNRRASVASNYKSVLVHIPQEILHADSANSLYMILYPRGNRSASPVLTIDSYLPNSQREFWQTSFNHSFIVGHFVTGIILFLMFLAFWVASHKERRDYLYFAVTSLFLAFAYFNVIVATPSHNEPIIWIIARSSMVFASIFLMIFISIHAKTDLQFRVVNRLFLFLGVAFAIQLSFLDTKYAIDSAFGNITNIILTPTLLLTFFHSIKKLRNSKNWRDVILVVGVITTFLTAFYDMYYFKKSLLPFCWTLIYGYALFEMIIVIILASDLWKLFRENRYKTVLLEQKNEELEMKKQKLEQVSNGKSRFIRNMAHEFKTPLQGIVTIAELLQHKDANREDLHEIIHALNIQMQDHLYTILNVIDLSTLEENQFSRSKKLFDINAFIDSMKLAFKYSEQNRNNELAIICSSNLPTHFYGDSDHISRITINILTNLSISDSKSELTCCISWNATGEILEIRMTNANESIPARIEELLALESHTNLPDFSEDSRIDDIAVFVASKIIALIDGKISICKASNEIVLEIPVKEIAPAVSSTASKNTILVVEDNPVNRMLISKILEKLGYSVLTAEDGVEAVERALADVPSLIFMDVQMPNMNGLEATKIIRHSDPEVIIIALTANANESDCIAAGMNGFLSKPAKMIELRQIVERYLAS